MPAEPLILALDIGTSSVKTALFDTWAQRLLATTAHEPYTLHVASDGKAQLDPGMLERAVVRALERTLAARRKLKGKPPVMAVGMSCFWHSLLGAHRNHPTPIFTWADGRCQPDAERLRTRLNENLYHARTGCLLRAPYWPAKLRWLRRMGRAPAGMAWHSPSDWIYGRLAGSFTSSLSMASGTGLLDARTQRWDPTLLKLCGVREAQLPVISDQPFKPAATIVPSHLRRFPELRDALWFPALGDGACSNLGSDAQDRGEAALNLGTSGAVRVVCTPRPRRLSTGLFCYQVDTTRVLVGGAISNAGNLRAWALRELRLPDDPAAIERALTRRPMPNHGLTILPFWTVERSPSWPEHVEGTVTGLTYATTAIDLLQAITEAPYHRLAQITDDLAAQQGALSIVVSGGIQHSPNSLQRLANVLGRPLRACVEPEASLRGAAVYVVERLNGKIKKLPPGPRYHPKAASAEAYAKARQAQIALERTLTA